MERSFQETLQKRAAIIGSIRSFFAAQGYLEVDTPLLAPSLIPESTLDIFSTRYRAAESSSRQLYLIPSPELWMKRLLAENSGSIFQICKSFRNAEPASPLHNPEFTMLEWYTVGADYIQSMEILEAMVASLFQCLGLKPELEYQEKRIDCSTPFLRLSMSEAFRAALQVELCDLMEEQAMRAFAHRRGVAPGIHDSWEDLFHKLFLAFVEPLLPQNRAVILYDYPALLPTLARSKEGTPWAERWELYLCGVEIANCYSEEADPDRIEAFFRDQERKKRRAGTSHPSDWELVRLIRRFGFPECSGVALGVDRLLLFFLGHGSLRAIIPYSEDLLR